MGSTLSSSRPVKCSFTCLISLSHNSLVMWSCLGWWVRLHYESVFCKILWLRKECMQNCPPLLRNFLQKLSVEWNVFFHSSQGKEKSCSTSEWVIWATSLMCNEPGRFTKTMLHPGTVGSSRDCLAPRLPSTSDTRYCCLMLGLHAKSHLNGIDLLHGHLGVWDIWVE